MKEIHCSNCGGFISEPSQISYRLPTSITNQKFGAVPVSALCTCTPPVVYGRPSGRSSTESLRAPGLN